jgi:hypothetical protein
MLLLRDPVDCRDMSWSDLPLLLGVASLKDPFNRSCEVWCASVGGGDDICMARTDSVFRKRGRSLRARAPASLAGRMGFEAIDDSDGIPETKL